MFFRRGMKREKNKQTKNTTHDQTLPEFSTHISDAFFAFSDSLFTLYMRPGCLTGVYVGSNSIPS